MRAASAGRPRLGADRPGALSTSGSRRERNRLASGDWVCAGTGHHRDHVGARPGGCAPPSATARWRICSNRSHSRRSGTGSSAISDTARHFRPAPSGEPGGGRPGVGGTALRRGQIRRPQGHRPAGPTTRSPGGPGFRRRRHRGRGGQAGRGLTGDGVALPRTARRRGHLTRQTDYGKAGRPKIATCGDDFSARATVSVQRHAGYACTNAAARGWSRVSLGGSVRRRVRRWRTRRPRCCWTAKTASPTHRPPAEPRCRAPGAHCRRRMRGLADRTGAHRVVVRRRCRTNEVAKDCSSSTEGPGASSSARRASSAGAVPISRAIRNPSSIVPCRGRRPDSSGRRPAAGRGHAHRAVTEPRLYGCSAHDADQVGVRHVQPDHRRGVDEQDLQVRRSVVARSPEDAHGLAMVMPCCGDRPRCAVNDACQRVILQI